MTSGRQMFDNVSSLAIHSHVMHVYSVASPSGCLQLLKHKMRHLCRCTFCCICMRRTDFKFDTLGMYAKLNVNIYKACITQLAAASCRHCSSKQQR